MSKGNWDTPYAGGRDMSIRWCNRNGFFFSGVGAGGGSLSLFLSCMRYVCM